MSVSRETLLLSQMPEISIDTTRIRCRSTLHLPPYQGGQLRLTGITLILDPTDRSADGIVADTTDFFAWHFQGQLLYTGIGSRATPSLLRSGCCRSPPSRSSRRPSLAACSGAAPTPAALWRE